MTDNQEVDQIFRALPIEARKACLDLWHTSVARGIEKHGDPDPELRAKTKTLIKLFFVEGYRHAIMGEQQRFAVTRAKIESLIAAAERC